MRRAGYAGMLATARAGPRDSTMSRTTSEAAATDPPNRVRYPVALKLGALMLFASLVPIAALTTMNVLGGMRAMEGLALRSLRQVAGLTAVELDRLILDVGHLHRFNTHNVSVTAFCAAAPEDRAALRPAVQQVLDSLIATQPNIASAFLTDAAGVGIASTRENNVGQDLNFRDYMQEALAGRFHVSDLVVGKTTGQPGVYFSGPLHDGDGGMIGVLVLKLAGERIHAICRTADTPGEGFITLVNRMGVVLAHRDPDMLYRSLGPLSPGDLAAIDPERRYGRAAVESVGLARAEADAVRLATLRGSQRFVSSDTGVAHIVGYAPMREREWVVGIVQPQREVEGPARALQSQQLKILGLVTLCSVLVGLLLARRFVGPIRMLTDSVTRLARGDYAARVPERGNDELSALGRAFNAMAPQLQERMQATETMAVAREIQKGLLPQNTPDIGGLDVAASNVPADATGGDYYDFLDVERWKPDTLAVTVGDVTGHGVPAALLMATARSLLRAHLKPGQTPAELIEAVNDPLFHDSPANRFMTLMYAEIDRPLRTLRVVSAGHDPVLVYDPDEDVFFEVEGNDIPLGVEAGWSFTETERRDLPPRAVLLIGTDGIWESRSPDGGTMYGKDPLYQLLREHHEQPAQTIVDTLLGELLAFRGGSDTPQLDDITVVVIRLTDARSAADRAAAGPAANVRPMRAGPGGGRWGGG